MRELRVWSEVLDQLALGRGSTAADIIAQRLKALEQSVQDGSSWKKVKFLELVSEETGTTDKGEEHMMTKQLELEEKFRSKPLQGNRWDDAQAPKGEGGKRKRKAQGKGRRKGESPGPGSRGEKDVLSAGGSHAGSQCGGREET